MYESLRPTPTLSPSPHPLTSLPPPLSPLIIDGGGVDAGDDSKDGDDGGGEVGGVDGGDGGTGKVCGKGLLWFRRREPRKTFRGSKAPTFFILSLVKDALKELAGRDAELLL